MNELVDLFINLSDRTYVATFIRSMFYLESDDEYYETYLDYSSVFKFQTEDFLKVYNIFHEWDTLKNYPISRWKGLFLELLTYKLLIKTRDNIQIKRESEIIIKDFRTNPIDFTVKIKREYHCYECKFSSQVIKKNQIDNLLGITNYSHFKAYLILFEPMVDVKYKISNSQLNYMLNDKNKDKITLITLENFSDNNPFLKE